MYVSNEKDPKKIMAFLDPDIYCDASYIKFLVGRAINLLHLLAGTFDFTSCSKKQPINQFTRRNGLCNFQYISPRQINKTIYWSAADKSPKEISAMFQAFYDLGKHLSGEQYSLADLHK